MFLAALYLVGVPGAEKGGSARKIWLPLCLLAFLCNGLLNTIVKAQQIAVNGEQTLPMLVVSFGTTAGAAFLTFLALAPLRKETLFAVDLGKGIRKALIPIVCIAFSNGVSNGLVTYLSSRVSGAWLYPCVLGGNMILVTLFSVIVLKEKINRWGWLGLAVGLAAMYVMNV